jgi:hypothetical protein
MRSALALAALACLFPAPARAELVQAELTGHVTSFKEWNSDTGYVYPNKGVLGFDLGNKVQATLRYDTTLPQGTNLPTGPGGYGLTLTAGGMTFVPSGSFLAQANVQAFSTGKSVFVFSGQNGLVYQPNPSLVPIMSGGFYAADPQGKLSGPSGAGLPGSAALAGYDPKGNATIQVSAYLNESDIASTGINVDSITVDSIVANQAPEPSALVLFGLGGLSLLGLAPRRVAARLLR